MSYSESSQPIPAPVSSSSPESKVIAPRNIRASAVELYQINELMYQDTNGVETWIALGEARRLVKQSENRATAR